MRLGKAKMWASLVGGTATAVATAAATAMVVLDDGLLDVEEYGVMAVALGTLIGTVRAVWSVVNKPVPSDLERLR